MGRRYRLRPWKGPGSYSEAMSDSLATELIHVTCRECNQITSFNLASLTRDNSPHCPYCGKPMQVDLKAAQQDGMRQALELDESVDSLGSVE